MLENEGRVIDVHNPASLGRCQYVHLRGRAPLINATVKEKAAGA